MEFRFDPDQIRAFIKAPPRHRRQGVISELEGHRADLTQYTRGLLLATEGRERRASEQREIDKMHAQIDEVDQALDAVQRFHREVDQLRLADQQMYGAAGSRDASHAWGDAIRNAIDEVRDGRATSFVDVPTETRALTEGGAAGEGVGIQMMTPVRTLRASSVVMSLPGIRHETMTSDRMRFPRVGSATVAAVAELGTLQSASTGHAVIDVIASRYGVIEYLSNELVEDYSASALEVFGSNLVSWLGLKVDSGLFEGDGSGPGIVGIRNISGANSTSVAGTISMAKYRQAEYELRVDNGTPTCWITHPRVWKQSQDIVTGIASDTTTVLSPNQQEAARTLLGYPVFMSTQLTLVEGATNVGSWAAILDTSQLAICERRPARLEFSKDFKFDTDQLSVRATWRGGLACFNAESVSLLTDIR